MWQIAAPAPAALLAPRTCSHCVDSEATDSYANGMMMSGSMRLCDGSAYGTGVL
ncbi:MAG: hypothetical protein ABI270_03400 [Nitrosospira sp.]